MAFYHRELDRVLRTDRVDGKVSSEGVPEAIQNIGGSI